MKELGQLCQVSWALSSPAIIDIAGDRRSVLSILKVKWGMRPIKKSSIFWIVSQMFRSSNKEKKKKSGGPWDSTTRWRRESRDLDLAWCDRPTGTRPGHAAGDQTPVVTSTTDNRGACQTRFCEQLWLTRYTILDALSHVVPLMFTMIPTTKLRPNQGECERF
ncbi:hypothetical protein RRG08_026209 [Elysia crispata]|uniref:Uncharacterized protein n=1 Tax=Elysia crispata TaxID=231223 RepID=A0AAE0ZAH1_9GAST|nr:hypothetical protein RRG08_026209 [Elysia crispata]